MKKPTDQLTLNQLLDHAKRMPPSECIDVYYDPDTHYFYINPYNVMTFWIPTGASFICRGNAIDIDYYIENFIGNAVRKLIREETP